MSETVWQNVAAHKADNSVDSAIVFTMSFCFCAIFAALAVLNNIFFLFGVLLTGTVKLVALRAIIKNKAVPKLVFEQREDKLIIYPDTDKQTILPLADIVEIKKKKYLYKNQSTVYAGKIIIYTEKKIFKFAIEDLGLIFLRLRANLDMIKPAFV